ncbi:unnamed protein product [Cylicostephanus goldi]|uniref:Uncharacterized protein n=1 Tax=Cylicostephanus goldi TaxID=71465 RepID=A0A3P7ME71_CYLGO|nr:unnamed protein product [Cylicostephanus goldi]
MRDDDDARRRRRQVRGSLAGISRMFAGLRNVIICSMYLRDCSFPIRFIVLCHTFAVLFHGWSADNISFSYHLLSGVKDVGI